MDRPDLPLRDKVTLLERALHDAELAGVNAKRAALAAQDALDEAEAALGAYWCRTGTVAQAIVAKTQWLEGLAHGRTAVGRPSSVDSRSRLAAFLTWRGWKHPQLAAACRCSVPMVSHVLTGRKNPGVAIVHAIERVTAAPTEAGAVWPEGPIRTEEWLTAEHDPIVPPGLGTGEGRT